MAVLVTVQKAMVQGRYDPAPRPISLVHPKMCDPRET
jgi:hypothetical protein